jgi:hypothetical protein
MPYAARLSELSILIASSVFSNVYLQIILDCPILIAPSVFSNVYLQFLWIVRSSLSLRVSPTLIQ